MHKNKKLAVLIPCYNEEASIAKVVGDFRRELPDADIYVYDNNSTDRTVQEAERAGAIVRHETRQGKGNVIRSMLNQIQADVYVMVDGDDTYPAEKVGDLLAPVLEGKADIVNGSRLHKRSASEFKALNLMGNKFFCFLVNRIFGVRITDLLTGYRAFNRDVAIIPLLSRGFDIETEFTLKTIESNFRLTEVPVDLKSRPDGSVSKIRIVSDGILIVQAILAVMRDYKPLTSFGSLGVLAFLAGLSVLWLGSDRAATYAATFLIQASMGLVITGIILHTISRRFQEQESQIRRLYESIIQKAPRRNNENSPDKP